MYKIYLTNRSVNEATSHYIALIERAVIASGEQVERIYQAREIRPGDIVITVEAKDFYLLSLLKPRNKKINWYQGVTPEEAMLVYRNPFRKLLWEIFERQSLKKAILNLFVSRAMLKHYQEKYRYQKNNHLEIPCYNQALHADSFHTPDKYKAPTFVYSGSLSKWQCLDQVLSIYQTIEKALPNAHLSIFTRETAAAEALVSSYQLKNTSVKYVPVAEINAALQPIKYGWLIREDIVVNRVASPTKMNTYMASGLIPIYSDVMEAFRENIHLGDYDLKIPAGLKAAEIAARVIDYERNKEIIPEALVNHYQGVFSKFYEDESYVAKLGQILAELRQF